MQRQSYFQIIILFALFLGIAYYAYQGNERVSLVEKREAQIIEAIKYSNEITSYAKRAEGHLLLYLMLGDNIDKSKFYKRMTVLKKYIEDLNTHLGDDIDQTDMNDLFVMHQNALATGENILLESAKSKIRGAAFNFVKHKKLIKEFHKYTSQMRKQGVQQVKYFVAIRLDDKKELNTKIKRDQIIIWLVTSIGLILSVLLTLKSRNINKLTVKLREYSYQDTLTGVGNRRAFNENIKIEWARAVREETPLGLMMIDIDNFKSFNDLHGHAEGDKCLVTMANAVRQILKRPSDILTRYGGEEFIAILPNTENVIPVAEACREAVEELNIKTVGDSIITITVGCGVFRNIKHITEANVLKLLDDALYYGKTHGKNQVVLARHDTE